MFIPHSLITTEARRKYERLLIADGATACFPLRETSGGFVSDIVNGNQGTVTGGALGYTRSPVANSSDPAVYFSGAAGQVINVPTATSLHPTESFTLECWALMLDTNPHEFICKGSTEFAGAPSGTDFELGYVGGLIYLQFFSGATGFSYNKTSPSINSWHHYIARFTSGSDAKFFFDGVGQAGKATALTSIGPSTGNFKISGATYRQNGYISYATIFQKALPDDQCINHYNVSAGAA